MPRGRITTATRISAVKCQSSIVMACALSTMTGRSDGGPLEQPGDAVPGQDRQPGLGQAEGDQRDRGRRVVGDVLAGHAHQAHGVRADVGEQPRAPSARRPTSATGVQRSRVSAPSTQKKPSCCANRNTQKKLVHSTPSISVPRRTPSTTVATSGEDERHQHAEALVQRQHRRRHRDDERRRRRGTRPARPPATP